MAEESKRLKSLIKMFELYYNIFVIIRYLRRSKVVYCNILVSNMNSKVLRLNINDLTTV